MTPGALAFFLWEGPAAAGLVIERFLLPRDERLEEAMGRAASVHGPTYAVTVLIATWCIAGPILFVRSTLPRILIHTLAPVARRFNSWADGKARQWQAEAAEIRSKGEAERNAILKRYAWESFNGYAVSKYRTAMCSTCGLRWPTLGETLQSHPGPNLEQCPGSGSEPAGPMFPPGSPR
jgi:hypothetical protein